MRLDKPELCLLAEDGAALQLRATRCTECRRLTFPPARYGCPHCGTGPTALVEELRDGRGRLINFITIHAKLSPDLDVPAIVGQVDLGDGLVEDGIIEPHGAALVEGMAVHAVPVEVIRGGEAVITCRFAPLEG